MKPVTLTVAGKELTFEMDGPGFHVAVTVGTTTEVWRYERGRLWSLTRGLESILLPFDFLHLNTLGWREKLSAAKNDTERGQLVARLYNEYPESMNLIRTWNRFSDRAASARNVPVSNPDRWYQAAVDLQERWDRGERYDGLVEALVEARGNLTGEDHAEFIRERRLPKLKGADREQVKRYATRAWEEHKEEVR